MYELTVGRMRRILQDALDQLEGYEDSDTINTVTNTYFLKSSTYFACTDGFVSLDDIQVNCEDDNYEDDDYEDED